MYATGDIELCIKCKSEILLLHETDHPDQYFLQTFKSDNNTKLYFCSTCCNQINVNDTMRNKWKCNNRYNYYSCFNFDVNMKPFKCECQPNDSRLLGGSEHKPIFCRDCHFKAQCCNCQNCDKDICRNCGAECHICGNIILCFECLDKAWEIDMDCFIYCQQCIKYDDARGLCKQCQRLCNGCGLIVCYVYDCAENNCSKSYCSKCKTHT